MRVPPSSSKRPVHEFMDGCCKPVPTECSRSFDGQSRYLVVPLVGPDHAPRIGNELVLSRPSISVHAVLDNFTLTPQIDNYRDTTPCHRLDRCDSEMLDLFWMLTFTD